MKSLFYKFLKFSWIILLIFESSCNFDNSNNYYFEQDSEDFFDYCDSFSCDVHCDVFICIPDSRIDLDYLIGDFTYEIRLCFNEPVCFNDLKISNDKKINAVSKRNYQKEKCFIEYDFFIDIPSNINSLSVFVEYLDYSVSKDYRVFSNDLQISFLGLKTQCKYNPGQIVYVNDFRDYKELCDEYNLSYLSLSNEYFNEYGLLLLWQGTPSYPPSSASFKSCVLYRNTLYAEVKTSSSIDGDFTNDYAFVYVFAICVPLDVAENYEKIFYKEFAKKD